MLSTQPYKGTRDFYPDEMHLRKWMFGKMQDSVQSFGFLPYDGPMLEPFELYAAKTGEEIVNQQLYWMMDRGERKMAVRPEMTPTLARMVAGKFHELPKPIRWYSIPNLWRYERPQKGRLREHWQLNVDILGGDPLRADAEILKVAFHLLNSFGAKGKGLIRVNHRKLMDSFFLEQLKLSPEAALKVTKAIDARDKIGEEKFATWLDEIGINATQKQAIDEFFRSDFKTLSQKIGGIGAQMLEGLFRQLPEEFESGDIVFDPTIMRGMDYYTGTVFEMYDRSPENRRAIFGGGRYDNLIGLFGKNQLAGVGFGLGDVTFQDFLTTHQLLPSLPSSIDVFMVLTEGPWLSATEKIENQLRAENLRVISHLEVSKLSEQLKHASKHHARFAVFTGEDEFKQGLWILKDLQKGTQVTCTATEITSVIRSQVT